MKCSKRNLFILFLCISVLFNFILFVKVISSNNYERSIIGCYQSNGLTFNFFRDNTLRISNNYYYVKTEYNKIGENMYMFKEKEDVYFVFFYNESFNLFNSSIGSVMQLDKISNQTMVNASLKEKKDRIN
ncbi:MAG: hypothetical protein JJT76_03425 [Clostridiaceae bacterium]|nr:hypothetical protein [Clostridiaceae bacterium]